MDSQQRAAEPAENMTIEVVGEEKVAMTCAGIARRAEDLRPVFATEVERMEHAEENIFDASGQYVETGALRDSLTRSGATGAVRKVTSGALVFGSSLYYAAFQVEDPGPVTPAGGLKRSGHPSAVLKVEPSASTELTVTVGEYIMRGVT